MKHIVHKWGGNILSIHDGIEPPIRHPSQKNEIFHEKIIMGLGTKSQGFRKKTS